MIWTDHRIAQLTHMWREGYSATMIADEMGTTKGSIIGKVHRLGLPERISRRMPKFHKPRGNQFGEVVPANRSPKKPKVIKRPALNQYLRPVAFKPASTELPMPEPRMVTLLDLEPGDCRWPVGDPGEPGFGFCGQPNENGAYCPYHRALSYIPPPKRKARVSYAVRGWRNAA